MRIAYMSDLHLDNNLNSYHFIKNLIVENIDSFDVLVIPGDISNSCEFTCEFLREIDKLLLQYQGEKIAIFVPGNHEYYTYDMGYSDRRFEELNADCKNTIVLGCGTSFLPHFIRHYNVTFVGGTLWTDFEIDPSHVTAAKNAAPVFISDYKLVYDYGMSRFSPDLSQHYYIDCTEDLKAVVSYRRTKKTVVITHHLPSIESVAEKYKQSILTSCFASGLLDKDHPSYQPWTAEVDLWIHGHTHFPADYVIDHGFGDKTHVVCNPHGYAPKGVVENKNFGFKVIEI